MSQVTISASVELQLQKLRQQAREAVDIVEKSFKSGATKLALPVDVQLPKDLQARIDKALANVKVPTLTIPVQFGNPGAMPGGGGSAFPNGAASPNWSYYFGQLGQQLGRAGFGNGAGGSNLFNPFSGRGLARLVGSGGIAYGALEAMRLGTGFIEADDIAAHPERIQRQWYRPGDRHDAMADPYLAARAGDIADVQGNRKALETLESVPVLGAVTKFIDAVTGASKGLEDLERVSHESVEMHKYIQNLGDANATAAAELTHDPLVIRADQRKREDDAADAAIAEAKRRLAEAITKQAEEREKARTASQGPGSMSRFDPSTLSDSSEIIGMRQNVADLQKAEAERRRVADAQDAQLKARVNAAARLDEAGIGGKWAQAGGAEATMAGEPMTALRYRHDAEREQLGAEYDVKLNSGKSDAEKARIRQEQRAAEAAMRNRQGLEVFHLTTEQGLSMAGLDSEGRQLDDRRRLDPDAAAREALSSRQNSRYTTLSMSDAAAAEKYKGQVMPKEMQELEERQHREREKAEGDSKARILSIAQHADAELLRSAGETFEAQKKIVVDSTAEQVAALKRTADAATTLTEKRQKLAEATAVEAAGVKHLNALYEAEKTRAGDDTFNTDQSVGTSALRASGQNRAAAKKDIDDRFQAESREIIRRGGPNVMDELYNASRRQDAAHAELNNRNSLEDRGQGIETRDLEERARGQQGVGEVLGAAARFDAMRRNASGDPLRLANIARQRGAWAAAYLKDHKPNSHVFSLEGYHDALQESISSGVRNDHALALADAMGKGRDILNPRAGVRRNDGPPGMSGDSLTGGNFSQAVGEFRDMIRDLKRHTIAVIGH